MQAGGTGQGTSLLSSLCQQGPSPSSEGRRRVIGLGLLEPTPEHPFDVPVLAYQALRLSI